VLIFRRPRLTLEIEAGEDAGMQRMGHPTIAKPIGSAILQASLLSRWLLGEWFAGLRMNEKRGILRA
jgi:hypothetical protein